MLQAVHTNCCKQRKSMRIKPLPTGTRVGQKVSRSTARHTKELHKPHNQRAACAASTTNKLANTCTDSGACHA